MLCHFGIINLPFVGAQLFLENLKFYLGQDYSAFLLAASYVKRLVTRKSANGKTRDDIPSVVKMQNC